MMKPGHALLRALRHMPGARRQMPALAVMLSATLAAPAGAQSFQRANPMTLKVYTDDNATKGFGRLDALVRRLNAAGHACKASTYERGGSINCGPDRQWTVLFGFYFAPSRAPELIVIHSIRANGINGGEMPKEKFAEFLDGYLKPATPQR